MEGTFNLVGWIRRLCWGEGGGGVAVAVTLPAVLADEVAVRVTSLAVAEVAYQSTLLGWLLLM